ncbi:hypothetical protein AcW1_001709 [Taiwanofungus camphoratus]|nr:hypothetical protein AcV5_000248 [Antrodia cinnamomea]KAI0944884.1 hypothetical protein AcV7_001568 [Antrodia cinnamomea]KAI0945496.1 hypothetical protein AcW1_001709 [Antrodia cinnamomea]
MIPPKTRPYGLGLAMICIDGRSESCECVSFKADFMFEQWKQRDDPLFVLHDGPPYANGDLHMGHALNKILKDIINRYHVLLGHRVHYLPGWDCHGLPIENKVLQMLGKDPNDLTPNEIRLEAEAFAKREVQKQLNEFRQLGIMADWGLETTYRTLDKDYELRQLGIFQKMVVKGLIYRHYRPVYYSPSSRSALAEAELEYKDNHISHSAYVAFELEPDSVQMGTTLRTLVSSGRNVRLLVWTTTPWTLTANMAIAVNPDMMYKAVASSDDPAAPLDIFAVDRERVLMNTLVLGTVPMAEFQGSDLVGATYRPIFSSLLDSTQETTSSTSLPIISSSHVTPDSGTGLVHCAPAHGAEDYAVFRELGLLSSSSPANLLCHVDGLGQFTEDVVDIVGKKAAVTLVGKYVLGDGGKAIVALLSEAGALRLMEKYRHRYPYDWKTDKPVIVIATSQWFANLEKIKDDAITSLGDVIFYPPASRNRLESFIRSRSEWCISRQRVWGVPIPALYHIPSDHAVLDGESLAHIISVLQEKGAAYWWDGPVDEFVPPALREGMDSEQLKETWRKGTDTMDVWFDSGTSWSMLDKLYQQLGGTSKEAQKPKGRHFGADVCLEGSDQHRGWFQSQLLTAIGSAHTEERERTSPYGTVITHGMVLDEAGKKMSKSLGNIVSPMTVINGGQNKKKDPAYGAEVLRLWAATVEFTKDMSIGPTVLSQCAESLRKIRNSARFILGVLEDRRCLDKLERRDFRLVERFIMNELYKLENTALQGYATYDFPRVINALSNFANITLSSLYLDITKDCLYANAKSSLERRVIVAVLNQVLTTMTSVLAPVLPHLAEEIHATLPDAGETSVFTKKWIPLDPEWEDLQAETDMSYLLTVRSKVLSALEGARRDKLLKSSLEADVFLIVPNISQESKFLDLLRREESFLKTLFIVSDVCLTEEGSLGTESPAWLYSESLSLQDCDEELRIHIRPAALHKCPRCWTYTRHEEDTLCRRCSDVLSH